MPTYEPIFSVELTASAPQITFNNIPQTYTDLVLISNIGRTAQPCNVIVRCNGDTNANYSTHWLVASAPSTAESGRGSNQSFFYIDYSSDAGTSVYVPSHTHFMNYSATNHYKMINNRAGYPTVQSITHTARWNNSNAINSITIFGSAASFTAGSTFHLYGIGAVAPKAIGGDIVSLSGGYWYHIFNTAGSSSFTRLALPPSDILSSVDVYMVGGGGGGGQDRGGGGGAGAYRAWTSVGISSSACTVTVGAGGNGASGGTNTTKGSNGGNSSFAGNTTVSVDGGGGGGSGGATGGLTGGSGGGGSNGGTGGAASGNGTGFAGAGSGGSLVGSGGGGMSSAGVDFVINGGPGGNGLTLPEPLYTILGQNIIGGGGGGGVVTTQTVGSGTHGGGNGGNGASPTGGNATTYGSGGGGAGGGNARTGGNGFRGFVAVRYPA